RISLITSLSSRLNSSSSALVPTVVIGDSSPTDVVNRLSKQVEIDSSASALANSPGSGSSCGGHLTPLPTRASGVSISLTPWILSTLLISGKSFLRWHKHLIHRKEQSLRCSRWVPREERFLHHTPRA